MSASTPPTGQASAFHGYDHLRRVCLGADVSVGLFESFVDSFSDYLNDHHAISIRAQTAWVGMNTASSGQRFVYRVLEFIEKNGVSEPARQQFISLAKHFDARNIGLNVESDGRSLREISTVFGDTPPIDVVHAILSDAGLESESIGLIEAVAEVFEQKTAERVGFVVKRTGPPRRWVAFRVDDCSDIWDRLHTAAILCGLSDVDWAPIAAVRECTGRDPSLVSVGFYGGEIQFSMVLEGVPSSIVETLLVGENEIQNGIIPFVVAPKDAQAGVEITLQVGKSLSLRTYLLG